MTGKRFDYEYNHNVLTYILTDNGEEITSFDAEGVSDEDIKIIINLLNEQEKLIKRLKTIREEQTETILKEKRKIKELETRNKRQYNRLKELTELMYEKQWEKLENMVDEWEKQEELLQAEWGTYCENE